MLQLVVDDKVFHLLYLAHKNHNETRCLPCLSEVGFLFHFYIYSITYVLTYRNHDKHLPNLSAVGFYFILYTYILCSLIGMTSMDNDNDNETQHM
jgi:hypothetical protein